MSASPQGLCEFIALRIQMASEFLDEIRLDLTALLLGGQQRSIDIRTYLFRN